MSAMKKLLSFALAIALCAPVFAQRGAKLEQTITMGDAKMSLNYVSISYGEGKTVGTLLSKEGGDMRKMFNERMAARPTTQFKTSIDVTCGDAKLAAGDYDVYFSIDDDLVVSMNFKQGDKVTSTKLKLNMAGQHEGKKLLMCLYSEEAGAGVYLSFGKIEGMISFVPTKKDGK